jgi:hypothetical protein
MRFCIATVGPSEQAFTPVARIKGDTIMKAIEGLERAFDEKIIENRTTVSKLFSEHDIHSAEQLRLVRLLNRGNVVHIVRLAHRIRGNAARIQIGLWLAEQLGVRITSIQEMANWRVSRKGLHIDFARCLTKNQMRRNSKVAERIANDAGSKFWAISIRRFA